MKPRCFAGLIAWALILGAAIVFSQEQEIRRDGGSSGGGGSAPVGTVITNGTGSAGDIAAFIGTTTNLGKASSAQLQAGLGQVYAATNNAGTTGSGASVLATSPTLTTPGFSGAVGTAINMGSHQINNVTDPASAQDAATKNYVDAVANGLSPKPSVVVATAAALPANTYANGALGVGATLTATNNGALTIDGVAVNALDRVLVKNEAAPANNGIFFVTATGSGILPYILTRSLDNDTAAEFDGAFVFVEGGTANASSGWVCTTTGTVVVGTTAINWTKFSAPVAGITGTVINTTAATAGAPLVLSSTNPTNTIPSFATRLIVTNSTDGTVLSYTNNNQAVIDVVATNHFLYLPASITNGWNIVLKVTAGPVMATNTAGAMIDGSTNAITFPVGSYWLNADASSYRTHLISPKSLIAPNLVFAGPVSGTNGLPTMRGEVVADLPVDGTPIYTQTFALTPSNWVIPAGYTASSGLTTPANGAITNWAYWNVDTCLSPSFTRAYVIFSTTNSQFTLMRGTAHGAAAGVIGLVDWLSGYIAIYVGWDGTLSTWPPSSVVSNAIPWAINTNHTYATKLTDYGPNTTPSSTRSMTFTLYDLTASANVSVAISPSGGINMMGGPVGLNCLTNGPVAVSQAVYDVPNVTPDVLIVGDSHTGGTFGGGSYAQQIRFLYGDNRVSVSARGGDAMADFTNRITTELSLIHPSKIMAMIGANDEATYSAPTFATQFAAFTNAVFLSKAQFYPMTLVPQVTNGLAQTNQIIIGNYLRGLGYSTLLDVTPALTTDGTTTGLMNASYVGSGVHMNTAGQTALFNTLLGAAPFLWNKTKVRETIAFSTAELPTRMPPRIVWDPDTITPRNFGVGDWVYYHDGVSGTPPFPNVGWKIVGLDIAPTTTLRDFMVACANALWTGYGPYDKAFSAKGAGFTFGGGFRLGTSATTGGSVSIDTTSEYMATSASAQSNFGYGSPMAIPASGDALWTATCPTIDQLCNGTDTYWCFVGWMANAGATWSSAQAGFLYDMFNSTSHGQTGAITNHWICVTGASSAYTWVDSGVVPDTSGTPAQKLSTEFENGAVVFYVNGSPVATNTTHIPAIPIYNGVKYTRTAGTTTIKFRYLNSYVHEHRAAASGQSP